MSWYEDLTPCLEVDDGSAKLIAIGWLEKEHPYTKGEISEEFFERLCTLLQNSWRPPFATLGVHFCTLCRFTGANGTTRFWNYEIQGYSSSYLFIPANGIIYVSPLSIAHYIDAHEYCPPKEFQDAVMACPEMKSIAYLKALLANGGRALVKNTLR